MATSIVRVKPKDHATVTVSVRLSEKTAHHVIGHMSTDLPAANLGELVAEAVQYLWKEGYDPVDAHLVIHFS